ncbi:MAG: S49 family peptidase, partial [Planctomycetes bacterium]|nr:S49 family peptidase [Planctomycetota bacterium]
MRILLTVAVCLSAAFPMSFDAAVHAAQAKKSARARASTSETWASIAVKGGYPEGAQGTSLFGSTSESLSTVLERLRKAGADRKITGVILRINGPSVGWAKRNEIRQAIAQLRAKGKKVIAQLDSATSSDMMIAAACDEIIMPESAVVMLLGLRAEITFYKNLFDKLNIKAEMLRVGEFKSAAEPYSRSSMSEPFRREMNAILDDYFRQMVDIIAQGRKLDRKKVIAAIDSGPHTAQTAKKLGLIDRIAYADEITPLIRGQRKNVSIKIAKGYGKKKVDTDFSGITGMMKMMQLLMGGKSSKRKSSTAKIAVIYATGTIMTGKSTVSLLGGQVLGSDTFIKAVRTAAADKTVKAIVVRIDSPGGSALASDLMWRALQKAGKPVVASMGDVAASGGYYIAMGADAIYAEPGTLTGSIGVVGGKIAFRGLFEKVGITTTVLKRGKNSGVNSTIDGFTDSERKAMQNILNAIYKQFTTKAALGRKMKYEKLEKMARGR